MRSQSSMSIKRMKTNLSKTSGQNNKNNHSNRLRDKTGHFAARMWSIFARKKTPQNKEGEVENDQDHRNSARNNSAPRTPTQRAGGGQEGTNVVVGGGVGGVLRGVIELGDVHANKRNNNNNNNNNNNSNNNSINKRNNNNNNNNSNNNSINKRNNSNNSADKRNSLMGVMGGGLRQASQHFERDTYRLVTCHVVDKGKYSSYSSHQIST